MQRIARWTSNPKVLGSIPRWDGYLKLCQWDFHRKDFVNHFQEASFPAGNNPFLFAEFCCMKRYPCTLLSFICLHVGTRDFFTYADIELFGFPTFKLSNRPSVLKLVQTSSRGVHQSYWNVGCFLQDQRWSAKLRDKIKIVLVICGPSDISGPCLMFKDDLDPRLPKEVLMPFFPHVLER